MSEDVNYIDCAVMKCCEVRFMLGFVCFVFDDGAGFFVAVYELDT